MMVDAQLIPTKHKAAFAETVCKRCHLCTEHTLSSVVSPDFCLAVYEGDENRFLAFLVHIQKLKNSKKRSNLASFEAFCGLFCNSFPACPNKSEACNSLDVRVACYACFVKQWGQIISEKVRHDIYKVWSGIDLDEVGAKLSFNTRSFRKKERKALRTSKKQTMNMIGKALDIMIAGEIGAVSKKSKKVKYKKKIHTSTFHNDGDKAWSDKIKELLSKKETYDDETDD